MPIDPVAKSIIELMDQHMPRVEEHPAAESRRLVRESMAAARMVEPEPVARVEDRHIPGPAGEIPVRIYWPDKTGPLPVTVYFHGGGWVICDLDSHDAGCRAITNAVGCVVVSVDYRLAPEHRFPAAVDDAYAATVWVAEHASELGADAKRLAVAGDSAGGNLAAAVSLMARDRGGPSIRFQLLIYPVLDFSFDTESYRENADGYFLTRKSMEWYWEQYLADPADGANPYASPLRAPDVSELPPALILTAECDPLRDEGEAYGRRLQEAGVATYRCCEGMFHGFFGFGAMIEGAKLANEEAFAALRDALT